jgi:hypothetical protein
VPQPTPVDRPVILTDVSIDLDGDGVPDRFTLTLASGTYVEDGGYTGCVIARVRLGRRKPVPTDLCKFVGELSGLMPNLEIVFQDYNHNGHMDFNLGSRLGAYTSTYQLFEVTADGSISLLPFRPEEGKNLFVLDDLEISTHRLQLTTEGFSYSDQGGTLRTSWRWNRTSARFELDQVRALTPSPAESRHVP